MSNVAEFQSSMLKLLAKTNTLALNTLNRMKLRDSPVCEACPYNATESLQHFLLECPAYKNICIRDKSFQEIVDYMHVFMPPCLDFTKKRKFLNEDTWYYLNQECGVFFDLIGKSMLNLLTKINENIKL